MSKPLIRFISTERRDFDPRTEPELPLISQKFQDVSRKRADATIHLELNLNLGEGSVPLWRNREKL
jgi:hypothetical protein